MALLILIGSAFADNVALTTAVSPNGAIANVPICRPCVEFCVEGSHCVCGSCVPAVVPCTACGGSCSRVGLSNGVCNIKLKCVARTSKLPTCKKPCPKLKCALPQCTPPEVRTTSTLSNGCRGCPHCAPAPCTDDSECTNGFCWEGSCQADSTAGQGCDGFTVPLRRCAPGLVCQITSKIPDVGGICVVPDSSCPQCQVLNCPRAHQVTGTANTNIDLAARPSACFCPACCVGAACG